MKLTMEQIEIAECENIRICESGFGYDYKNQAWIEEGRYLKCDHIVVPGTVCNCYGSQHQGELVTFLFTANLFAELGVI
jgi:hypothetical protein